MKFQFVNIIFLVLSLQACQIGAGNNSKPEDKPQDVLENRMRVDSSSQGFPIQIGNEKGIMEVYQFQKFKNDEWQGGEFKLHLKNIPSHRLFKTLNKHRLIDSNSNVVYMDSAHSDYLQEAYIKSVTYDFVRGNTLYFQAILLNPKMKKLIRGRFALFYRGPKKGLVYSWISDGINDFN